MLAIFLFEATDIMDVFFFSFSTPLRVSGLVLFYKVFLPLPLFTLMGSHVVVLMLVRDDVVWCGLVPQG